MADFSNSSLTMAVPAPYAETDQNESDRGGVVLDEEPPFSADFKGRGRAALMFPEASPLLTPA